MFDDTTQAIRNVGASLLQEYANGSTVIGGINGPYDDPETPVRNLSHLAVIGSIEISKFGNDQFIPVLKRIGEDILSRKGTDNLWIMREKAAKDQCNGVIGHAWLNEGFIYLYHALNDSKWIEEAVSVSKLHTFDYRLGLWYRPAEKSIDFTLNHQLWYAATLAELNSIVNNQAFTAQLDVFMKCLPRNLATNKIGRIRHSTILHDSFKETMKQKVKNGLSDYHEKKNSPSMAYKEQGYHVFNMMALARLYRLRAGDSIWASRDFKKAIEYVTTDVFFEGLENPNVKYDASLKNKISDPSETSINIYGYPYNVPGFEVAYVGEIFKGMLSKDIIEKCLKRQVELTYDSADGKFGTRCHDKQTINYRVYEYYRFLEILA